MPRDVKIKHLSSLSQTLIAVWLVSVYLVKQRHQLAALHAQVVLVLGEVAVEHNELAEGVFEEWVDLWLRRGLWEQGAAPGLASARHVQLEARVLEAVCVTLLESLVDWNIECHYVILIGLKWMGHCDDAQLYPSLWCRDPSINTSRLEGRFRFYWLFMKGKFDLYLLWPFKKKLIF